MCIKCHRLQVFVVAFPFWILLAVASQCTAGLEIHCIDVGQGDCTLIISPAGGTFLFDAGRNGKGNNTVIPYLEDLGLTGLDYMGASHYHADHIGGLDEVVDHFGIDSINNEVDAGWDENPQRASRGDAPQGEFRVIFISGHFR